jgi:hypothetical protein
MSLRQCPHCLTQTFIDKSSEKWPCCGKYTNDNPDESINDIIKSKEKEEIQIKIAHTTKVSIYEVLGGILISLLGVSLIVFLEVYKIKFLTVVFIFGIGLAIKGIVDFKDMLKFKKEYNEKFGRYLSALPPDGSWRRKIVEYKQDDRQNRE